MIFDIYTHVLPQRYYRALEKKASQGKISIQGIKTLLAGNPALMDLDLRVRMLEKHPDTGLEMLKRLREIMLELRTG